MNSQIKKIIIMSARIAITLAAVAVFAVMLETYDYISRFGIIDNATGMLPVMLIIVALACTSLILWLPPFGRKTVVATALAAITITAVAFYPNAVIGNWWSAENRTNAETEPDISVYAPFTGSQTAQLDEPSTLSISDDLPVMDGATALYPVYAAYAQTVYDEETFSSDLVRCSKTTGAYDALISGEADVIFVAGPSEAQRKKAEEAGTELKLHAIGKEAFVFIVAKSNPVEELTYEQIQNIYSGKTRKWRTLGWDEGGDIIAFQRPEGSGSQTGLQKIMGDTPIAAPRPLPDDSLIGTNSLMQQVTVEWNGVQPALGYSYRFFATTMYPNPDAKLLGIDGVYPSEENIRNGTYPFITELYAVTDGEPSGNVKLLIDWITSGQGQQLTEKAGYVSSMA